MRKRTRYIKQDEEEKEVQKSNCNNHRKWQNIIKTKSCDSVVEVNVGGVVVISVVNLQKQIFGGEPPRKIKAQQNKSKYRKYNNNNNNKRKELTSRGAEEEEENRQ